MAVMKSDLSATGDEFRRNRTAYDDRIADLHARRAAAMLGGPERARRLHKERKQLLPRERISALLDPGSPFLEFCQLAGEGMYEGVPPGGSIVTGVGMVSGRACMIIANDATVKGGTYYGITCKKHVRAQKFAWQHRLPCVTMVQSGGANLPDQPNIFPDDGQFGSIFYNQIRMSSEGIAQIATVHGPSTAGGAYMPALCDETVIVRNQGAMFLGGPQLVYAATKEEVDMETLGGGEMHSRVSGVTDHLAESDSHAIAIARDIVANLGDIPPQRWDVAPPREPRFDPRDIYGLISTDPRIPTNNREIVARLVDGSEFHEFKPLYGETLITGFARIMGFEVGILCNNGVLFSECALEGDPFHRPVLQAQHPAIVHGGCHRVHGRTRGGGRRHRQARRQDDHRDGQRQRAEIHADHRKRLWRGLSRDVRPRLQAPCDDDVAARPLRHHGAGPGREHARHGQGRGA